MTNKYDRKDSYVPALQSPQVRRVEILPPQHSEIQLAQPAQTVQRLQTSHVDRARGFNISTSGLALLVGTGGVLMAAVGWSMPLLSLPALALFFSLAMFVWAGAWLWFNLASPDGVSVLSVLLHYRLLRHEQKSRLDRIDSMMDGDS